MYNRQDRMGGIIMTIEERAKEYASKKGDISLSPIYNESLANVYKEGYIAGAKEQKAIDEEVRLKKCDDMTQAEYDREVAFAEWYHKNGKGTPTYSDAIEWARRELIDKAMAVLVDSGVFGHKDSYGAKAFKQAMEE